MGGDDFDRSDNKKWITGLSITTTICAIVIFIALIADRGKTGVITAGVSMIIAAISIAGILWLKSLNSLSREQYNRIKYT